MDTVSFWSRMPAPSKGSPGWKPLHYLGITPLKLQVCSCFNILSCAFANKKNMGYVLFFKPYMGPFDLILLKICLILL